MMNNTEFPNLTYSVEDLLGRLRTNRATHAADVASLKAARLKEADSKLRQLRETLLATGEIDEIIQFPEIDDNTGKYDDAIEMLDMTNVEEIELNVSQFRQLVLDKWSFSSDLNRLKTTYKVG